MATKWLAGFIMNKKVNNTPIKIWNDIIHSDKGQKQIKEEWKMLFKSFNPYTAGMIVSANCAYKCKHCIYPPDYGRYNNDLPTEKWKQILKALYDDLDIKLFVHNGRCFDERSLDILAYIQTSLPGSQFGIIDNGTGVYPLLDHLYHLQPDWIDISIDGMEKDHDLQRNQKGLFEKAVETITAIIKKRVSQKINVLTCLTTINQHSVIEMISHLNKKGVHNFFISPVSVRKNYRPSPILKVDKEQLNKFIRSAYQTLHKLDDAFIEINLFNADYLHFISHDNKSLFDNFESHYDHFLWRVKKGRNELVISWYPLSLDGIREIVINSNGDILTPKAMARSCIASNEKIGSLLNSSPKHLKKKMIEGRCFNMYLNEFLEEKRVLVTGGVVS